MYEGASIFGSSLVQPENSNKLKLANNKNLPITYMKKERKSKKLIAYKVHFRAKYLAYSTMQ